MLLGVEDMERVAVFVDAGYLFAQGAIEMFGKKLQRGEMVLDHSAVAAKLKEFAETQSHLRLLRIYWYDGTSRGPTPQHIALAELPDIKVRLGFVNTVGQQKGVDSLIVTDMITLARNGAIAECVLLSGDEDVRVGVQLAQEYGVRVHLLGVKPARGSQSLFLRQEADATYEWTRSDLESFLNHSPSEVPEPPSVERPRDSRKSIDSADPVEKIAKDVAATVPFTEVAALVENIRETNMRPEEIDRRLLVKSGQALGKFLDPSEKRKVRNAFLDALVARLKETTDKTR